MSENHSGKNMKKVLILFGKSNWEKSQPFKNKDYQYSYEYFYSLCQKNGVRMYRASYQWYDYQKHIFKYAWVFKKRGGNWERVYNIRPDLIYDKTKARAEVYYKKELIAKNYSFINDLNFTRIIDDKFITSLLFKKWSKRSWIVKNNNDLRNILPKITTNKVVLKPISESGGKDIQIVSRNDIFKKIKISQPRIVQDFIDSSKGIPGVNRGMHDLRLVFINNEIVYSYIREPRKGNYLANLAQGGSLKIVTKSNLPIELAPIVAYANDIFQTFSPRIYSIDFMFDGNGKPWVIELNSMPGLYFTPNEKPYMVKMYKKLLCVFKKELNI